MKIFQALIFAIVISAFLAGVWPASAERVATITDKEPATKIFLNPDSTGTVIQRKHAIPFLPFTPCSLKGLGEYKHDQAELKVGDVITHEGHTIEVGDITILRYNDYAGNEDSGKIQTCQISKSGFHPADQKCDLIWINFDNCFVDKVK